MILFCEFAVVKLTIMSKLIQTENGVLTRSGLSAPIFLNTLAIQGLRRSKSIIY